LPEGFEPDSVEKDGKHTYIEEHQGNRVFGYAIREEKAGRRAVEAPSLWPTPFRPPHRLFLPELLTPCSQHRGTCDGYALLLTSPPLP